MTGRGYNHSAYRYSFNGQEKEIDLSLNITTAKYWEYDSRIGRRWNIDPEGNEYSSMYLCFSGNPISKIDPEGNRDDVYRNKGGKEVARLKTNDNYDRFFTVLTGSVTVQDNGVSQSDGTTTSFDKIVYHKMPSGPTKPVTNTTNVSPTQVPLNTKPQPTNNEQQEIIAKPVQKTFDVAGAVATTTQGVSAGYIRAGRLARLSGGVGTVPVGIPSGLDAKSFNVVTLGRVNASTAIKVTNIAKTVDAISRPLTVISGAVNIVKDGKITAGDAGVAMLTAAQVMFPAFGFAVGIYDVGSLIFGYRSSSDLVHDIIDSNLPNQGWDFKPKK